MLSQPDMSGFIVTMLKEVDTNEMKKHWKEIKKTEVNNEQCSKNEKLKTILSIFNLNISLLLIYILWNTNPNFAPIVE